MQDMTPIQRGSGRQHVHHKSEAYRQNIRRVARFNLRTHIRTAVPQKPPSEWVVSQALYRVWPEFLRCSA
jgi:hypothetical protein